MEQEQLIVHDLNIVAYLRVLGFKYAEVPRYVDGKVIFYFRPTEEAKKAILDFETGKAVINPKVFSEIRRNLKKQIDAAVKEALSELTIQKAGGNDHE